MSEESRPVVHLLVPRIGSAYCLEKMGLGVPLQIECPPKGLLCLKFGPQGCMLLGEEVNKWWCLEVEFSEMIGLD